MIDTRICHVSIKKLHGRHDIEINFHPNLNIIHGRNGNGKTTLMHILANLIGLDFERFYHLRFEKIEITNYGKEKITLNQTKNQQNELELTINIRGIEHKITTNQDISKRVKQEIRRQFGGRPVYLPAFRSILEAISQKRSKYNHFFSDDRDLEIKKIFEHEKSERQMDKRKRALRSFAYEREQITAIAYKTLLCREWFGNFVPIVRFPSLWEVSEELSNEYQDAELEVAATDRAAFSEVFAQVLTAVLKDSETPRNSDVKQLLQNIQIKLSKLQEGHTEIPSVYYQIYQLVTHHAQNYSHEEKIVNSILEVYDKALSVRSDAQQRAFERIETFENSVNAFLINKRFSIQGTHYEFTHPTRSHIPMIELSDGKRANLSVLSSGERHVLTLLFSATHMSQSDGLLLIDEPELSLHVEWQHIILGELMRQAGGRQVIACTHSPEVAAEHRKSMVKLKPTPSNMIIDDLLDDSMTEI